MFAITGFLVFIAIILAVNHGKAGQFPGQRRGRALPGEPGAVAAGGLRLQRSRPAQQRLQNGEKVEEALESLRKAATNFDRLPSNSLANGGMITDASGEIPAPPSMTAPAAVEQLKSGSKLWTAIRQARSYILRFGLAVCNDAGSACSGSCGD